MSDTFNFEAARLNAGHTRDSLARLLGCSPETIRTIELGKRPGPKVGARYAEFFDRQYTDLWPIEQKEAA